MIQGDGFTVDIIRSKRRKTLALAVADGRVSVRMPAKMGSQHAERFIREKTHWIQQKLALHPPVTKKQFIEGETFLFLGQELFLKLISASKQNKVSVRDNALTVELKSTSPSQAVILKHVTAWFKSQAKHLLEKRCRELARSSGLQPKAIFIKTYKARWGSCSRSGEIQFNWKLIMAPDSVIDYVIIHELCHLSQHNHSPAFWQLVENFCSDFKVHRTWLKNHGQNLTLD
ncbi:M48 family metallopeptidase [Methylophaga sp.]|uniref:M48 family metallopeptidase n=1 Tax=Methylophaga sp. TaxID=2024840 RepID=UPI003F6A470C